MNSRHQQQLWLKLWREARSDEFHQTNVNEYLQRFLPKPTSTTTNRIFVPLCGKSLDMIWLAQQGYEVIGIEISPIAIKAFFKENKLSVNKHNIGAFNCWSHGNISILHGDYFALTPKDLGLIDLVYDRAALTALPKELRARYVTHLQHLIPQDINVLLLTIEDQNDYKNLQDVPLIDEELLSLYEDNFTIRLEHMETVIEPSTEANTVAEPACLYKVYRLNSK